MMFEVLKTRQIGSSKALVVPLLYENGSNSDVNKAALDLSDWFDWPMHCHDKPV